VTATATAATTATTTAKTADLEHQHQQMDQNRPPASPDEGIDSDDGKDHEYENSGGADNALGMNEPNFCTPLKDDNSVFKAPHPRGARIRPFAHSEEDNLTHDSPLRKRQMPCPQMSSTPLSRPEINDANGPKFGVEGMRQNGIPVKNLFSEFSSCADGELFGDSTLEDANSSFELSAIASGSGSPQKGNDFYLMNSFSECGLGNAADALNHKIPLDESDVGKEMNIKLYSTPEAQASSKVVWSLEEQLRLLQLERASPAKTATEVLSSPEYEKNGPNPDGVSAPKRKRGDCSIDSGVFEHDGVHKHPARESRMLPKLTNMSMTMGSDAGGGSDVDEIQRGVDSVLIE